MDRVNLKTEQVKSTIVQIIADSKLPVSIAYYIMKDLTQDLEKAYYQMVEKENEELKKQQENDESEKKNSQVNNR